MDEFAGKGTATGEAQQEDRHVEASARLLHTRIGATYSFLKSLRAVNSLMPSSNVFSESGAAWRVCSQAYPVPQHKYERASYIVISVQRRMWTDLRSPKWQCIPIRSSTSNSSTGRQGLPLPLCRYLESTGSILLVSFSLRCELLNLDGSRSKSTSTSTRTCRVRTRFSRRRGEDVGRGCGCTYS